MNDKIKELEIFINDYHEVIWNDIEARENILYLLGRYLMTGKDISDEEITQLYEYLKEKINKYVKEKAN